MSTLVPITSRQGDESYELVPNAEEAAAAIERAHDKAAETRAHIVGINVVEECHRVLRKESELVRLAQDALGEGNADARELGEGITDMATSACHMRDAYLALWEAYRAEVAVRKAREAQTAAAADRVVEQLRRAS